MPAELTVTGEVPVDVKVNVCAVVVFTVTLPKLRLAALTANFGLGAAVLVPLKATTAMLRSRSDPTPFLYRKCTMKRVGRR
jgi:hypothetical protein